MQAALVEANRPSQKDASFAQNSERTDANDSTSNLAVVSNPDDQSHFSIDLKVISARHEPRLPPCSSHEISEETDPATLAEFYSRLEDMKEFAPKKQDTNHSAVTRLD